MKQDTERHETCRCKCRLDAGVLIKNNVGIMINAGVNASELIDKGICDKGFIWSPSNCECACDKSCDVGECLDYEYCKCKKKTS